MMLITLVMGASMDKELWYLLLGLLFTTISLKMDPSKEDFLSGKSVGKFSNAAVSDMILSLSKGGGSFT